jgi:hypothetical protein
MTSNRQPGGRSTDRVQVKIVAPVRAAKPSLFGAAAAPAPRTEERQA